MAVAHSTPGGIHVREEHFGVLSYLGDIPYLGCFFSSIRWYACQDGISFVPKTYLNTNWCLPYNRYALFNGDRATGPEAVTARVKEAQIRLRSRLRRPRRVK